MKTKELSVEGSDLTPLDMLKLLSSKLRQRPGNIPAADGGMYQCSFCLGDIPPDWPIEELPRPCCRIACIRHNRDYENRNYLP